ncbi:MAG: alpha/beta fold hydrolase [Flavobacteriales bacterium]|nr:alpha/beta fold hydrolase [Flavobacteriales bacterium]
MLEYTQIKDFTCTNGAKYPSIRLSYEVYGRPLGSEAPVVMVFHALTGNSTVSGKDGWWNGLISDGNVVDTLKYTVLSFNIPGNGYDGFVWQGDSYMDFLARDMARMLVLGAKSLGVEHVHTMIGGSTGGCLVWEAAVEYPDFASQSIIVGADCKSTDWVQALSELQMQAIMRSDEHGLHDARMLSMMFFRTPQSFDRKFARSENAEQGMPNVVSWLRHHGEKLEKRFSVQAYKSMLRLISTVDISRGYGSFEDAYSRINSRVVQVGIDTDLYFQPYENLKSHQALCALGKDSHYSVLHTMDGHDGFLIEFEKLQGILREFF